MKPQHLQRRDPFAAFGPENPFALLRRLTGEMERLFDVPMGRLFPRESGLIGESAWMPSIDVFEKDGSLVIRADLPGLTKDEVSIEVTDEAIALKGERKKEIEEKKEGVYRLERTYGSFYRAVALPDGVRPEDVKATFTNGVLEVTAPLPPAAKEAKPRRVEIQETTGDTKGQSAA